MTLGDSFQSAIRAITANKLRSALTMLGVIIGVGSVIAMIGIGEGTKKKSLDNISKMGSNMLTVMPNWNRGGQSMGASAPPSLQQEDVEDLRAQVPLIENITGVVSGNRPILFGNKSTQSSVTGGLPEIAIIRNASTMYQGNWFTYEDNELQRQKAVLGYQVYDDLFQGENAVGATIRIGSQNYEVVGVVEFKGGSGWRNPDDQVYIPLETAKRKLLGKTKLDQINIQASNTELMPITQIQVEEVLNRKRRNAAGESLFRVFNQGEMIEQMKEQTALLGALLAGIASVSLLVGGIGIMNIMLVSVTERTREIGLRKAIGAKREGILTQFLLESVVMCLLGGVLGIVFGSLGVIGVAKLFKVPPIINTQSILIAFVFSAAVGVFFGLYPAMRASRLEPIQALRYE
jgi:putative ABC transport system permease protein